MDSIFTPIQMAKKLNVSTTTLRRYENLGLVPDVPRTSSNRRYYTPLHVQAFLALRSLVQGFDLPIAYEVMSLLKEGYVEQALWMINVQQYNIQVEKQRVEEIMRLIHQTDFSKYRNIQVTDEMKIGEVAVIAGVNPSTIRHWENEGLIRAKRNAENGYRVFTSQELKKIIVLSSLRKTVFFIESMKQLLEALETHDLTTIERSFKVAIQKLNEQLEKQMNGISEMMRYIQFFK
ncbi:MAG: MerR family DNA-binding transcriptional regulator [Paenibacillus lautus]|jgi:DNA-binding transcriptional MerR regulator|uniref:MerR family DNA-binding transcriptional regulator n=1 Tax=Paenibacillus lautus TaxID=1401 RepID=UPI0026F276DC|nr:MerR family transcriptional regulator [Paenibacillus lautus]MCI1775798.1 MerR family DNA-binding transcriptional regulator [Paenibacillus lautus]